MYVISGRVLHGSVADNDTTVPMPRGFAFPSRSASYRLPRNSRSQICVMPIMGLIYGGFLTAGKSGGFLQSRDPCSYAGRPNRTMRRSDQRGFRDALIGNESGN